MELPKIGFKITGNDGREGTDWEDSFVLDLSKILDTEVLHRRSQVRSAIGYLMAWDETLDLYSKRVAARAVDQKVQEERLGV